MGQIEQIEESISFDTFIIIRNYSSLYIYQDDLPVQN